MKVIFLDIDGVLNSAGFQEENKYDLIDRKNEALIKRLIDRTGAAVVLSSGWKLWFDDGMRPTTEKAAGLYNVLCEYGIALFDKTPDFSTEEIRKNRTFSKVKAKEIKAWLSNHTGIESYAVIDDMDLKDGDIAARTVRTNGNKGFSEEDIHRAIKILCK